MFSVHVVIKFQGGGGNITGLHTVIRFLQDFCCWGNYIVQCYMIGCAAYTQRTHYCERSELPSLFNARIFYIYFRPYVVP